MNIIINRTGDSKGVYLKDATPGLWIWDRLNGSQEIILVIRGGWVVLRDTMGSDVPRHVNHWNCTALVRPFKGSVVFNAE